MLRLGRAATLVDRRLTPWLHRMHSLRLYRLLGYVRLADYVTERLGMSLRRCQSLLRLGRVFEGLPRLDRALEAGEVSYSKVEIVAGVAVPETEGIWLERAKRLTLARLREMVRETQAGHATAGTTGAGATSGEAGAGAATGGAGVSSAASDGTGVSSRQGGEPSLPAIEQEEPGRLISFDAPAPVFAMWHWCLDLIRRIAGQQEPAWRCAEYLAAEFLSGVPDMQGGPPAGEPADRESQPVSTSRSSRQTAQKAEHTVAGGAGIEAWEEACAAVREALVSIGSAADVDAILSDKVTDGRIDELDAWELDARLRWLVRLRQSLSWRQGRLLAALASLRLHRELGFDTLDDWVTDRLSMSPRRARYLTSLERRLHELPLLADAYRRGLVSWCQARLLVRVVRPATQSRWIRYARQVTVRRLEDVVIACEVEVSRSVETRRSSPPATNGAQGVSAPAGIGAPQVDAPAHVGAPPLPPSEPSPSGDSGPVGDAGPDGDSGCRHTSAPGNFLPGRNAPVAHTSAQPSASVIAGFVVPGRRIRRRITFWAPIDVATLWDSALWACRAATGRHLDDWECFLIFVQALRDTWENPEDPHWRRRYRIFERVGWRCMAPGCSSRSGLNEHHIISRSRQGSDDEGNLVTLCIGHHQQGVHEGRIACVGRAPAALWWDLGRRPAGEPLIRYFGERVVTRRPCVQTRPAVRPAQRVLPMPHALTRPPAQTTPHAEATPHAPKAPRASIGAEAVIEAVAP